MNYILRVLIFVFAIYMTQVTCVSAKDWEVLKGNNFIVYYRMNVPEEFIKTVLDSAEDEHSRVLGNLGVSRYQSWANEKRASIYIYSDEKDYVSNGNQPGWSHGWALASSKIIKTYPSDQGFFDALLPHELGHIIFYELVGPYADVPLWLNEGIAMYQEKAKHIGAAKIVQEALEKGQFIPLTQLTVMRLYNNSSQETVDLFYAESASIVNFLITQLGEGLFFKLCRELKEKKSLVEALSITYRHIENLEDLNKRWIEYLKGR